MKTIEIKELANVPVGETATIEDPETGEKVTLKVIEQLGCMGCHFVSRPCKGRGMDCTAYRRFDNVSVIYERIDLDALKEVAQKSGSYNPEDPKYTLKKTEPKFTQKDLELLVSEYVIDSLESGSIILKNHGVGWVVSLDNALFLEKGQLKFEFVFAHYLNENHLFDTALEAANFWFENKEKIK